MAQLLRVTEDDDGTMEVVDLEPGETLSMGVVQDSEGRDRPCVTIGDRTVVFDPDDVVNFLPILMQARSQDMECMGLA